VVELDFAPEQLNDCLQRFLIGTKQDVQHSSGATLGFKIDGFQAILEGQIIYLLDDTKYITSVSPFKVPSFM